MKALTLTLTTIFLLLATMAIAQGVAINENGAAPDPSAMLDVQSTEKGVLVPRMSQAQRDAISSPATGLLIYQTDNEPGFYFNAGTPVSPVWLGIAGSDGIWQQDGNHVYRITGNIGIGEMDPAGKLHISSPGEWNGISFTGTGLNDLSVDISGYNGTGSSSFAIRIQNPGPNPNLVEISSDGGTSWSSPIPIEPFIDMGFGVSASFGNTSGYTFGDRWDWTVNESFSDVLVVRNNQLGLGTSTPAALLHVEGMETGGGNVLFTGEFKSTNPGDPPAEGPGTRMMWYPDKAAFRVGEASSHAWNAQNIGNHSVAWGGPLKWENGEHYSTAPWASGDYSTAWGARAYATGKLSTAWGGFDAEGAWPWGYGVYAGGTLSTAWGASSSAQGYASTSWGSGQAVDEYSTAWGGFSTANARYSTAWGFATDAISAFETALGRFNTSYSTAGDINDWNENDRLFIIGNGSSYLDRSDALVLLKNGNLGLGSSEPESRLHLLSERWTKAILEHQGSDHRAYLGSDNQAAVFSFNTFFQSGSGWNFPTNEPAFAFLMHRNNQRFEFRVRPEGGSLTTAMVIRVNGNTGIGINNPQHKLSVAVSSNTTPNGDGIGLVNSGNNNYWNIHMSASWLRFSYNNENLSYIHHTTGDYVVTSDARLKENIEKTPSMLDRVKQLNVVSYNYKRDATGRRTIGLLAQETRDLFPELVHKEDETDYYGISYMGLSVIAIKTIQEQQRIIEELKAEKDAEISALSNRLEALEELIKNSGISK